MKFRLATLGVLVLASVLRAAESAPDFPPGVFTDNGSYSLADFKGKVLVLFFYEQDCPSCRGTIPKRNLLVERYKDKPVKFIAVAAGDSLSDARSYQTSTKLAMPVFADSFSMMEKAYGISISLKNIYQMRAVDADGNVRMLGLHGDGIDKVLDGAKWKYKDAGYDAKLNGVIEMLEWNQYEAGMKGLATWRKNSNKDVAESANKLYDVMKAEAEGWKSEADAAAESDPGRAAELYARIAACFPQEEIAKQSQEANKKLTASKAFKDEQAARRMYAQMKNAMGNARPNQQGEIAQFCRSIAKKYPETATGKKAATLATQLGS